MLRGTFAVEKLGTVATWRPIQRLNIATVYALSGL